MFGLLRKELRAQTPFAILIAVFISLGYLASYATTSLALESVFGLYAEGITEHPLMLSIISFIFATSISYGLMIREFDDRTIEFVDALPVSRSQFFFAKWLAALLTLSLFPLLDALCTVIVRTGTRNSLDESFHFSWIQTISFLIFVELYCFLSIGMVLSFFRRFGWLIIGLVVWMLLIAGRFNPALKLENLAIFSNCQFTTETVEFSQAKVVAYFIVGTVCLGLAYALFVGTGPALLKLLGNSESQARQILLISTTVVTCLLFFGIMIYMNVPEDPEAFDADVTKTKIDYPSWATSRRITGHYDATYPRNLANRANNLLDIADEDYDTVAKFFSYDADTVITVDMTTFTSHHLGTAYWNKLKMNLAVHETQEALRRTLGHETAHVVIESLSDNQLREHFGSTRFFHEGVATYVERRFFSTGAAVEKRLGPAILASREEASFARLVDNTKLRAEHDSYLVYSLGEVFVAATVERFGDEAPGEIARTFATKRHTEGLSGVLLWRSVFQAAGFSLNEAVDEYYQLLDAAQAHHQSTIDTLPELRPIIEWTDGLLMVRYDEELPDGWEPRLRIRPSLNAADDEYNTGRLDHFKGVSREYFVGSDAWIQVGVTRDDETIYQPWQKIGIE